MYDPFPLVTVKKKGSTVVETFPFPGWTAGTIPMPVRVDKFPSRGNLVQDAIAKAIAGNVVLWIENTVAEAQDTFTLAKFLAKGATDVGLLHSRFTTQDRGEAEGEWISRLGKGGHRSGCLLVSTQVCEQSIDIDADILYTSMCPTDMLLQRIGRMWRHRANDAMRLISEPVVNIFGVNDILLAMANSVSDIKAYKGLQKSWGKSAWVYDMYTLCCSAEVWNSMPYVTIPDDMRFLLETTYSVPPNLPYNFLKAMRDADKASYTSIANAAANTARLFSDVPHISTDEETSTRLVEDGSRKVCLVTAVDTTLHGEPIGYPAGMWVDKSKVKKAILMSSLTLPPKSIGAIGPNIVKDVTGDKYTETVHMRKVSSTTWVPVDVTTGVSIPKMTYTQEKGWQHAK
jgi:hypothetical protein